MTKHQKASLFSQLTKRPTFGSRIAIDEAFLLNFRSVQTRDCDSLVCALRFANTSVNGSIFASGDESGMLRVFNAKKDQYNGQVMATHNHKKDMIYDLSWSHNDNKLVTSSGDKTSVVRDTRTGHQMNQLVGHTSSVKVCSFQPKAEEIVVTGARDGKVFIWDLRCARGKKWEIDHTTGSGKRKKKTGDLGGPVSISGIGFLDDTFIASSSSLNGDVKIWDLRSGGLSPMEVRSVESGGRGVSSLATSASGRSFLTCSFDHKIHVFDSADTGRDPIILGGHQASKHTRASFSPDGEFVASGSSDGNICVWKLRGRPRGETEEDGGGGCVVLPGSAFEVSDVHWSPSDFSSIVSCSSIPDQIRVWGLMRADADEMTDNEVPYIRGDIMGDIFGDISRTCSEANTRPLQPPSPPLPEYAQAGDGRSQKRVRTIPEYFRTMSSEE